MAFMDTNFRTDGRLCLYEYWLVFPPQYLFAASQCLDQSQKELPSEVQHMSLGTHEHHSHSYHPETLRAWSQDKKWQKIDWKSESFCSWGTLRIIQPWQLWLLGLANFQRTKAFMIVSLLDTEITSRLSSGTFQRDKHIKPLSHSFSGNRH